MSGRANNGPWLLLAGAALGVAALIVWAVLAPRAAAAGWLIGFAFWSEVSIGSLLLLLIHRLTGGRWGKFLEPELNAAAATIPLLVALIVPLFVAIPVLYPWFHATGSVKPDVLSAYLNTPLFVMRSLIAIAGWAALTLLLPRLRGPRGQLLAAAGLVFHAVVIGAIGFDWFLSLDPPFASSSFGASLAVMQLIAALSFALVRAPARVNDPVIGDLGGLLLAFVLAITYLDFMALLVIWYGDVPRTTAWFVAREARPWQSLVLAAFALLSAGPILALILTRARVHQAGLRVVAASALLGVLCGDAYFIAPRFGSAALVPAVLATIAIGLLLAAFLARATGAAANIRWPAYGK